VQAATRISAGIARMDAKRVDKVDIGRFLLPNDTPE
jgi:hypothetical protein